MEGEAVCFFHPSNRAALACDSCGRFVCSICDLPVGTRHLCPVCLSKGLGKEKLADIVPNRFLWSRLSFTVGVWPLLLFFILWWAYLVSGGVAIIAGIIGLRKPGSLVNGKQVGYAVTGILGGLLQMAIFVGMFSFITKLNSFK